MRVLNLMTCFTVFLWAINSEAFFSNAEVVPFKTISLQSAPEIDIPIYRSKGKRGPGILLVHGNSSSSRSYIRQLYSALGNHYQLYLLDLPGHGLASKVDEDREFPRQPNGLPLGFSEYQTGLVEAVSLVANDPDVQAEVLVGWSLGGDVILLAQGAGLLPNAKGLMIFGTAPSGANPPTSESPFKPPYVPGVPGLGLLASFGFSFELDLNNPLGFNLLGQFSSPVPPYAPQPISEYDSRGKAYVQSFFNQTRRDFGIIPNLFLEDALNRSDDRFRASLGVVALGLLPPGGLPDELDVLRSLEGNPQDPTDDIPILVALGEEDAFINEEYLQDLKSSGGIPTLWKDEIFVFPRTGHAVHYERPLLFNLLLHKFVRDIER